MESYRPKDPWRVRSLRPFALRLGPTLPCNIFRAESNIEPRFVFCFIRWVVSPFDRPDEPKTRRRVQLCSPATSSLSRNSPLACHFTAHQQRKFLFSICGGLPREAPSSSESGRVLSRQAFDSNLHGVTTKTLPQPQIVYNQFNLLAVIPMRLFSFFSCSWFSLISSIDQDIR